MDAQKNKEEAIKKQQQIVDAQAKASVWPLMLSACIVILTSLNFGNCVAFSNVALPLYKTSTNGTGLDVMLTAEEGSWFVSLYSSLMMVGTLMSAFLSDLLGRKVTLLLGMAISLAGWVTIYLAKKLPLLLAGRVLQGLGVGTVNPCSYLLLSEISLVRTRGFLGSFNTLGNNVGLTLAFAVNVVLPFHLLLPVYSVPAVAFLVSCIYLVESPVWLVKRNRMKEARATLLWLRGKQYDVTQELEELTLCSSTVVPPTNLYTRFKEKLKCLRTGAVIKPVGLMSVIMASQAAGGFDVLLYYSLDILKGASVPFSDFLAIGFQLALVIGFSGSSALMSRLNRRTQLLTSIALTVLCFAAMAAFIHLKSQSPPLLPVLNLDIFIAMSFLLSAFAFSFGFGPVPFALLGEVFPFRAKALGCCLVLTVRYLTTFVSLKTFPTLSSAISVPYAMLAFCTIACAGGAAAMTWLPETRGLTLSQLAKIFGGNEEEDPDLTTRQCVASWARAISLTVIMAPDLGPQQQVQPLEVKNENEQKRE